MAPKIKDRIRKMPRNRENLHRHELIGLKVEITESTDPGKEGIKGKVKDETRETLKIDNKQVEKKNNTFRFYLPNGETCKIRGEEIRKRPAERL